jgi:hypothetical protein
MQQKFHTFTTAPLFTSADLKEEKLEVKKPAPKYKAGDIIYLDYSGDKYIITVDSYDENKNWVSTLSFKSKMWGEKFWTQDSSGSFYLDGGGRKIHPTLESLEKA